MPWVRFDDRYPSNRKVGRLSDAAFRLDASAICWCSENTTDGRIASDELGLIPHIKRPKPAAAELVRVGRWHGPGHDCPRCPPIEDGWIIHDFLDYNPSAEKVKNDREAKAERQRRWLGKKRRGDSESQDGSRDASQDESKDDAPSPSRPVPSRRDGSSVGGHLQVADARAGDDDGLDHMIIQILADRTGRVIAKQEAEDVRRRILAAATRPVENPAAYLARSLADKPHQFLPQRPAPHDRSVAEAIRAAVPRGIDEP